MESERVKKEPELFDTILDAVEERISDWHTGRQDELPRVLVDRAEREPYKKLQESKGPLNQIRIRTAENHLVDLGERSPIVRAIEPFRLFRVYSALEDNEAQKFIDDAIRGEIENVPRE
jgi:HD superfamily phosphohydrolase